MDEKERNLAQSAETDFFVATVICFCCVLALLLLLNLLLKEHRSNKVLVLFLKWLKERRLWNGNHKE